MLLKAQAPISMAPISLQNINRVRYKTATRSNLRTVSVDARKKFTPRTNKSFTSYKDAPSAPKNRSLSVERTKTFMRRDLSPSSKGSSLRFSHLKSTGKFLDNQRREVVIAWLETAAQLMKDADYAEALKLYKKVLNEENNPEALHNKGLCLIQLSQHRHAVKDLSQLIKQFPLYSKEAYTTLALCHTALGDYVTALRELSKGLLKFPKFVEGYILRGQMLNQQQKWGKAISDFYKAVKLNSSEPGGYLGLAESFIGMGELPSALKILEQATHSKQAAGPALVRRAHLLLADKNYDAALNDLDKSLTFDSENAEAYYYKAMALLGKENLADAALALEQTIKYDTEKKYVGAAIYNIGAIKIKMRDFYGAYYTFKRATDSKIEVPEQAVLNSYVEALLSLMKRQFKQGASQLSKILKKRHPLLREYTAKCCMYRAYAYSSIEKHEKACKDLVVAAKMEELDEASQYNQLISNGILISEKSLEKAIGLFEKAQGLFPKNIEPFAYQAAALLQLSLRSNNTSHAEQGWSLLSQAIALREGESDLHFYRGLICYYLGKPIEAITDLEIAIDKAEDNVPVHFLAKGLCYASLELYKEAIHDFSIVIQLDEDLGDAYFFRGRCAFILNDTNLAFLDYQKLIMAKPDDPLVHIHAGDLLVLIGSTEDAIKAYNNANSTKETALAHIKIAKCQIQSGLVSEALASLDSAFRVEPSTEITFDKKVIEILSGVSTDTLKQAAGELTKTLGSKNDGMICKFSQIHAYKGIFYFYLREITKARSEFRAALGNTDMLDSLQKETIELYYNEAVCCLLEEDFELALSNLSELVQVTEDEEKGMAYILLAVSHSALGQEKKAKSMLKEALKYSPSIAQSYIDGDTIEILPFSANSSFANKFPMTKIGTIHLRLSCNFPAHNLPSLEFGIEKSIFENYEVKSVKCRPEAPWLIRVKGAIQFTEELQDIAADIISESSKAESDDESESSSESNPRKYRSAVELPRRDDSSTAGIFAEAIHKNQPGVIRNISNMPEDLS